MANIVPGVMWQPVNVGNRAARRKGRGLCGHVAVSNSKNLVPGLNADWHFYLPFVGPAIQYIDLDLQCRATGAGNSSMAAFESQGGLGSDKQVNAEPWNDNQLNWAARILRHMHDTEGVPLRVMESSATAERGFGTHRLGVPGYMQPGTEKWSSARGKLCPGDAKHAQRYEVVRRAAALGGTPEEDDMAGYTAGNDPYMQSMNGKLDRATMAAEAASARLAALVATQSADVDEKALADQIIAGLAPQVAAAVGQQAGLTAEQVAEITEQVVRGVFADAAS